MNESVIVDSGPIVACLVAKDRHRDWASAQFARLKPPLITCEPVLVEASHIIAQNGGDPVAVLELVSRGILEVAFSAEDDVDLLASLMRRYRNAGMSLADACLVRLSEVRHPSRVFTTDSGFRNYRRHGRQIIPLLMPPKG